MEANQEDNFMETTERLLKLLRRHPNKMDVLRRFQGHFVNRKRSHLLESPSLSFRISPKETEESAQHMRTKLGDTAAKLLQEHHTLLQHRGSVNGLLATGAPLMVLLSLDGAVGARGRLLHVEARGSNRKADNRRHWRRVVPFLGASSISHSKLWFRVLETCASGHR